MPHFPHIESRWTWGNVLSAIPATLALVGVIGMLANQVMSAPAMTLQVHTNSDAVLLMKHDIDEMKAERHDDVSTASETRREILSQLERIENKLDQKQDKGAAAQRWER